MTGGARKNADSVLVSAIAGGARYNKAASLAGVSEATVYRRLQDPDFCQQVQAARNEMHDQASGRLTYLKLAAIEKAAQLMVSARSETVQLAAARTILEYDSKIREEQELEARLSALEERLAGQQPGSNRWVA